MREDMDKVIVERPRIGHSNENAGVKTVRTYVRDHRTDYDALDALPSKEKMSSGWIGWDAFDGRKELNENLNPLYRFLDSKVGTKWDDVYSELRKNIDPNSAVQMHIMQHVKDHVVRNVYVDSDGTLWDGDQGMEVLLKGWKVSRKWGLLYVHPRTGILCKAKKTKYYGPEQPITRYDCGDGTWHEKLDGIWYRTKYGNIVHTYRDFDGNLKTHTTIGMIEKKQLCKKVLRMYGLTND